MSDILIRGGRVIDPATRRDEVCDILISGNKIARIGKKISSKNARRIQARDMIVCPGLIDLHCHLRDPGRPDEETIASGSMAAVAGGFSSVCCMPNTDPTIDNEGIVNYIYKEAERTGLCRIFPIAAITKGRQGKEITEFGELVRAGAKGFSDDGSVVQNGGLMRRALEYSKTFNVSLFEHPIDQHLAQNGYMNESIVSTRLGLRGSPAIAEEVIVARDVLLATFTGARLHLCHISTKGAVALIRQAKKTGVRISCETCPHYFYLNDETLTTFDTNLKVNPPLRSESDRRAVIEGLRDGTIDCIATDHAPHCLAEKELEITEAPYGMIGLETALSLAIMELVEVHKFSFSSVVEKMSTNPARILGEPLGVLKRDAVADVTIFDPAKKWKVTPAKIKSLSKNTPLMSKQLHGRCVAVIVNGQVVYQDVE